MSQKQDVILRLIMISKVEDIAHFRLGVGLPVKTQLLQTPGYPVAQGVHAFRVVHIAVDSGHFLQIVRHGG